MNKAIIKHINKLQQKKYRNEFGEFLVEGVKGVGEALEHAEVQQLIVDGKRRDEDQLAGLILAAQKKDIPVEFAGHNEISDIKATETFSGILALVSMHDNDLEDLVNDMPIICTVGVRDPGNLGTIIRTADWFGISNILLSGDSVDAYNPKVVRSTMGSLFRANLRESEDLVYDLRLMKDDGYEIVALDMKGDDISKLEPSKKSIYLFGSESHGVDKELDSLISKRYTIPGAGKAESLNVAIAAGIVMSNL